jgi:hypothetical protein
VVVFAETCETGREGIVSKREGSLYRSGKGRNWLRTKNPTFVHRRAPAHYPMLKKSEIDVPRKSHFRAESVVSAGGCHSKG